MKQLRQIIDFICSPVAKPPQLRKRPNGDKYEAVRIGGEHWVLVDGERMIPHGQDEAAAQEQARALNDNYRLAKRSRHIQMNYSVRQF